MRTGSQNPEKPKQSATSHPRSRFETVALLLLSVATVGTAWCSFQAATWAGASQRLTNLSAASGRTAAAQELQYHQVALLDVLLFSQYINARASSNQVLA